MAAASADRTGGFDEDDLSTVLKVGVTLRRERAYRFRSRRNPHAATGFDSAALGAENVNRPVSVNPGGVFSTRMHASLLFQKRRDDRSF
jgi:hypothetical protein